MKIMQASYTFEDLRAEVENVMIRGMRRSAGLELISFAIDANISKSSFFDILQWFETSLRNNSMQVVHYADKIKSCGDSVLKAIQRQFFKVIKSVIVKAKNTQNERDLGALLQALIWDYKSSDLPYLVKYDIIGLLERGNGDPLHPIAMCWGKQIRPRKPVEKVRSYYCHRTNT